MIRLIFALLLLFYVPVPALHAQAESEDESAEFPPPFEIAGRYRALADSAADLEADIAALSEISDLESELTLMRERLSELRSLIAVADVEYMRPERISRIRYRLLQYEQRLESLRDQAGERLETVDQIRLEWAESRAFWRGWRDSLRDDGAASTAEPELRRALERIEAVIGQIEAIIPELLRVQREADALRAESEELAAQVAAMRAGRRQALTQRTEPVLFSAAYFSRFNEIAWQPAAALKRTGRAGLIPSNLVLLFVHLALIMALALIARRLRRLSIRQDAWSRLLRHPWTFAIFGSTALLASRYWLAPALWDVLMWALLAGSGATLATSLLRTRPARVVLYLLAVLYPLFLLAEALHVPPSLFRLGLSAVAFAGAIAFGLVLRQEGGKSKRVGRAPWLMRIGILMWAVVLVAEVLGFYVLARWILHATVTSAYVIFLVVFLMVVARGAVQMLLRVEAKGRLSFLRTVGVPLVERLLRLVLIVLAVVAALNVLDIWELSPSPLETWQRITSIGVNIGETRVTLDRILMAGIIVYLTILVSWALRGFARSEIYPRWEMERGVGDSMNALLHYVLIILAIFVGLGTLGFELQNFAIIAGALGIGIGFGLQNIVNNFVSGLILLFERPVRAGDTVVIDGEFGAIQKIGLRSTTVLRVDQSEVIVPNADLVSEKVINWTLSNPVARMILPVGVAYGTDVNRVLEILREAARAHPDVMEEPPPHALFMGFGDSSLDFEIRVWVQEFQLRLHVQSAILADVDRRFAEEGIEIPFPQRDLHVRSVDAGLLERLKGGV